MSARRLTAPVLVGSLAWATLAACASGAPAPAGTTGDTAPGTPPATSATPTATGELVVLAAASLQQVFTEMGDVVMAENPGLTITFSFGGSSTLVQQVLSGAPADVLATANTSTMADTAEVTEDPAVFTHNSLEIVVPQGNPAGVTGLVDLTRPELTIALCAVEVPCGAAAATAFEVAGLTPSADTYEKDVTATLTKAVLGEVDAAIVYTTDVISAGDAVEGIPFPEAAKALNDYPIAVLRDAPNPAAAAVFMQFVLSERGQKILADAGFGR